MGKEIEKDDAEKDALTHPCAGSFLTPPGDTRVGSVCEDNPVPEETSGHMPAPRFYPPSGSCVQVTPGMTYEY